MQTKDLVKGIDQMTNEELLEQVRAMRHRREAERPVAKKKVERAVKKESTRTSKKVTNTLEQLSPEDLAALAALLQGT